MSDKQSLFYKNKPILIFFCCFQRSRQFHLKHIMGDDWSFINTYINPCCIKIWVYLFKDIDGLVSEIVRTYIITAKKCLTLLVECSIIFTYNNKSEVTSCWFLSWIMYFTMNKTKASRLWFFSWDYVLKGYQINLNPISSDIYHRVMQWKVI